MSLINGKLEYLMKEITQYIHGINWSDPMTIHFTIMVAAAMPIMFLIFKTVSLGRTNSQAIFTTLYLSLLMALYTVVFIWLQLYLLPRLAA